MNTITVKAKQLAVVSLFQGVKDIRYYLNGVFFDMSDHCPVMVACDRHTLGAFKLPDVTGLRPDMSCNVPSEVVAQILKSLSKRELQNAFVIITLTTPELKDEKGAIVQVSQWKIELPMSGTSINFTPLDGKFPDYRRVIPSDPPPDVIEPAFYNPDYLVRIKKASITMTSRKFFSMTQYGKESTGVFGIPGQPDFIAVIMPLRGDGQYSDSVAWHAIGKQSQEVAA